MNNLMNKMLAVEEDPKESRQEDPVSGQTGKEYVPKTEKGKEMARILVSFCCLSKSSANTIVVYFGVSTMDKLLTSIRNTGRICSSSGRSATLAPMVWSEHFSCPHHNKIESDC